MARIRSIHPGLWTDEAFMSLSAHGRLLLMGIWTEAFDDGVFEWKPLTLKARIFPVDDVDVSELLEQLAACGVVARDANHPKKPGLIRNFQRFQRPKKPNSSGMLSDEWRTFVGASAAGSEPVTDHSSTGTENLPQMEDGGGSGEKEEPNGSSKKRASRLPENWEPDIEFAISLGLSRSEALAEATKFREWWPAQPGQKGVKLDWDLTWKTWCRKAVEDRTSRPRSTSPPQPGGSPKTFDEGGHGPRGQTAFLKSYNKPQVTQ